MSAFIDQGRERFGVEPICRTLDVSASAYYQRASGQRSGRVVEDERLLARIVEVHEANYCAYGYRKLWLALRRAGETVGRDRVKRLMRRHGIRGAKRRGKPWRTTTPDPAATRSPDLVNRDFTATRPDALWLADFTYLRCWRAWCSSASSSTRSAGASSAGSSPAACAPTSSSTPCGWPSRAARTAPTCS